MCFTGVIAIVALLLQCGESQVSLNRTMPSGILSVCPNATTIFTCQVNGSSVLLWTSSEYIGQHPVAFASSTMEGMTVDVIGGGVAELTQNSGNILKSELRVHASVNSSVGCLPDNANSGVTVNLTVYNDFPGRPTDAAAVEIVSSIDDSCTILVDWDPPSATPHKDINHYIIRDSVNGVRGEITTSTTSTLVTLQLKQCPSNLLISIAAVDRCGREGPSVDDVMPSFLPTGGTPNSTTNTPSNGANTLPPAIVSVVVVFVILVVAITAIIVVVVVIYSRRKTQPSIGGDMEELLKFFKSEMNKDDKPRYGEGDFKTIRLYKRPQVPPRQLEQEVKTFISEVVILLHTVKEEEMVAVYDYLKPPFDLGYTLVYQTSTDIEVTLGMFGNHKAALIHTSKGDDCQNETKRALKSLPQVQLIIAVGFAYGRRNKCKLGDVLVSTTVDEVSNMRIESGKIKIDEGGVCHTEINTKAKGAFTERKWIDFVCTSDGERDSEVHCGDVISSPMLLKCQCAIETLIARQERFIGGEMEGQELAKVIKDREHHHVDFIVIKGVADFGDGTKEKDWQFTASLAAAFFAETRLKETRNEVYYLQHASAVETKLKETQIQIDCLQHAPVALDHILTKFELQVLLDLLDAYSDERIKKIKQSILMKQGGDVSREEVENSLREGGLTTVADELEQNLRKGVKKVEHYEAYKAALKGAKKVTLRYLRFLLIGVPRSGKSTMRRRMLQEIINLSNLSQPSVSTGVAETYDILVKKLTSKSATISGSKWSSLKKQSSDSSQADISDEGDLHYLTHLFYSLISKPTDNSNTEEDNTTAEAAVDVADTSRQQETTDTTVESVADDSDQKDVNMAFEKLTNIHGPEDLHGQQETSIDTKDKRVAAESDDSAQSPADIHRLHETTDTTVESVGDDSDQKDVNMAFEKLTNIHDLHGQQETSIDTKDKRVAAESDDSAQSPADIHRLRETTHTTDKSVGDESGDPDQTEVDTAFEKLTNILQSDSPEGFHNLLKALTLINLMDVGGQPEFLDMLPAVTVGAALYLLFFRLDQDLHKDYPVTFLAPGENSEKTLGTSYCIDEVIHQALASIACFSGQLSGKKAESASSHAILVGTHKDKIEADDIVHKEEEVREKFEVYKGLLLPTEEGKPFFAVDNMYGTDESEMSKIRSSIEKIVKTCFAEVPIPASWLMFRIVLQLLDKPVVTLAQCEEIAHRLSMPTSIQEALWFFHHNIGSLLYYPDIPSVKHLVMCTPQVIFDSVTAVIIEKFKHGNYYVSSAVKKQFQQMGLFSLSDISKKTKEHRSTHLSPNQLVDVLKWNGILAEVCNDDEATSSEPVEPKFIIPAVLSHASEKELKPSTSLEASPLMIHFKGGFVPFGVFSASIGRLIARANSLSPTWRLHNKEIKKNKVKFVIDGTFIATLISRPQYLEIQIEQQQRATNKCLLAQICSIVRKTLVETLETSISKMKYQPPDSIEAAMFLSSQSPFDLAFTCCLHGPEPHSDHLMKVGEGHFGECLRDGVAGNLRREHFLWFEKPLVVR